ncbi:unnamed protein product [Moneuplotes crassus]|uniref:Uncharacterized protein n=1 Tax=Euplotes crassus TaxID=5936 RepID=A0AAD1UN75_EUPCR|nr:unnamed protein product [Moneuplotes crassus]
MKLFNQLLDSFSSKILCDLYSNINMAYQIPGFSPQTQLDINMSQSKYQSFLKKMEGVAFPSLNEVSINSIPAHNRAVKYFLENSIPTSRITWLSLQGDGLTDIGFYLTAIVKACERVTESIVFTNFQISELQLKKVFMACRHKERVLFYSCKFTFPRVPDFRRCLEGSKIWIMNFESCDLSSKSNWRSHPEEFENFVQGLANSDLKKSLETVDFGWCYGFGENYVPIIFSKYGLGHVQIDGSFMGC